MSDFQEISTINTEYAVRLFKVAGKKFGGFGFGVSIYFEQIFYAF